MLPLRRACATPAPQESEAAVDAVLARVLADVEPLEAAWAAELERLQAQDAARAELAGRLAAMERQLANLQG